jgi:hypothetical protein
MRFFLITLLLTLVIGLPLVAGQFGVANKEKAAGGEDSELGKKLQEATVGEDGTVDSGTQYHAMAKTLRSVAPIDMQDALDISVIFEAMQVNPETLAMIAQLKSDEDGDLEALIKDTTPMEIVLGLKAALDELKAIEILFADPERAVVEMAKEGMIEKKRVDYYKKNPVELADDTRKGVYFAFVSLAVAGGYI